VSDEEKQAAAVVASATAAVAAASPAYFQQQQQQPASQPAAVTPAEAAVATTEAPLHKQTLFRSHSTAISGGALAWLRLFLASPTNPTLAYCVYRVWSCPMGVAGSRRLARVLDQTLREKGTLADAAGAASWLTNSRRVRSHHRRVRFAAAVT